MSSISQRPGTVRRRNLALASILALFFPGAGHAYCGERRAARIALLCAALPSLGAVILNRGEANQTTVQLTAVLIILAITALLYAALDALRRARKINLTGGLYQRSDRDVWFYVIGTSLIWLLAGTL